MPIHIKNIVKKILKEQASGIMHVYRGCNLGGMNSGVGNSWGQPPYDGFIPNQQTGGNYSDPNLQNSPPATLDDITLEQYQKFEKVNTKEKKEYDRRTTW